MSRVGKNIKSLRLSRSMTQDDLAELLFVSRQTVSNYETGKSNPDIEMLVRLAEVLGTDPNSLIYGIAKPRNRKREWIKLFVAVGIVGVLAAAVLILEPVLKAAFTGTYRMAPLILLRVGLKPCLFLLTGWVIMQTIFLAFGIRSSRKKYIKWLHWAVIGIIAAYWVTIGPFLIWTSLIDMRFSGVSSIYDLGPAGNWLTMYLFRFSVNYVSLFLIPGILLRATTPERAGSKRDTPDDDSSQR